MTGAIQAPLEDNTEAEQPVTSGLPFILLFFAVGILTCFAYGAWDMPLRSDNQHYFYISERAASGVPPHVSQFDPKHGLSMLLSAAAIRLGRLVANDDVRAARALSLIVTAASIALAWVLTNQLAKSHLAAHLSALCMLSFAGFMQLGTMGARPKVFLVFFMLLSMIAVARQRPFAAGLFSALSFLCWQPGFIMLGGAAAAFLLRPRRKKALIALLASAILVNLLYEVYFACHGALQEQLTQAYLFPAEFMTGRFTSLENSIFWLRFHWSRGFGNENLLPLLFAVALAASWLVAVVTPRRTWQLLKREPGWTQFWACSHAAVGFTLYDQQGYPDLLLILPFVAVGCGSLIGLPGRNSRSLLVRNARSVIGALSVIALLALTVHGTKKFEYSESLNEQYALGRAVASLLEAGKTVYSAGCTHLLAFAHANNHVHFGYFFRGIYEYLEASGTDPSTYRPLKDSKMPDVILWARGPILGAQAWLAAEYTRPYHPEFHAQHVSLWRRKGNPAGARPDS